MLESLRKPTENKKAKIRKERNRWWDKDCNKMN